MRKYPFVLAAVPLLLLALACGAGHQQDSGQVDPVTEDAGTAAPKASAAAPSSEGAAKVGQAVRDGKFEFTVTKIKCGVGQVGSQYINQKAQGQFCLVTVKVKNIAKEPQTFSSASQFAYGGDGARFEADDAAGIFIEDNDTLFNTINPGNSVTGILVFDIPKNAKIAKLELHDSAFSGGIRVTVK